MIRFLSSLSRRTKQLLMLVFDFIAIIFCLIASFYIRLGYFFFPNGDFDLLLLIVGSPLLALPIFMFFGLYHDVVRFVSMKALWRISQGSSLYAITWGLIGFMATVDNIPRSVILINWLVVIIVIGGSRFLIRWLLEDFNNNSKNVIIYGAGSAGRQLFNALKESKEYKPIAFIDDDLSVINHSINGIKIYNKKDLNHLIDKKNINEVLIAIPSISRSRRKQIIDYLDDYPVVVRSLPGVSELAQGKIKVDDLLEINLVDLLGRKPLTPNTNLLKTNISKKIVMVTGAGGSIGSELCRQIVELNPEKLILYEISESSLYEVEQELNELSESKIEIISILGSISDKERVIFICKFYGVQTVYHAAAYKHVPLVESNQAQGVLNNSIGTLKLAQAAIASNVEIFVLISTDKAVRPTNIMGASKRIAELILQALSTLDHNTCFTMVRFGNVMNSSGSVIPLFKKQISQGGPITVTHKDIVRYFMTIPEAVELVIQAGAMASGGEVFLLEMGKPIRINDLALKMINMSGLSLRDENNPKGDIEIKYTGLRPGEKLYEELLLSGEFSPTENKYIMKAKEEMITWNKLEAKLTKLQIAAENSEIEKIYKLLQNLVPEFISNNKSDRTPIKSVN